MEFSSSYSSDVRNSNPIQIPARRHGGLFVGTPEETRCTVIREDGFVEESFINNDSVFDFDEQLTSTNHVTSESRHYEYEEIRVGSVPSPYVHYENCGRERSFSSPRANLVLPIRRPYVRRQLPFSSPVSVNAGCYQPTRSRANSDDLSKEQLSPHNNYVFVLSNLLKKQDSYVLPFDVVPGYEHTTSMHSVCIRPPTCPNDFYSYHGMEAPPPYSPGCSATVPLESSVPLSFDDAIDALSKFATKGCCYSKRLARQIKTKELSSNSGYQVALETFSEERSTRWHEEPHNEQTIDSLYNGIPPSPWEIPVPKPPDFCEKEVSVEVPYTTSVKECPSCVGRCKKHCSHCYGAGDIKCMVCDGLGFFHHSYHGDMRNLETSSTSDHRHCHHCNGGKRKCHHCHGHGEISCTQCEGCGRLKTCIKLNVKWRILKSRKVTTVSNIPSKFLLDVSGNVVFREESAQLNALNLFDVDHVNNISRCLLSHHSETLQHASILKQRQCVYEIPITEVRSQWKRKNFTFWIFGAEKRVYCPEYPVKCYGGCAIL